MANTFEPLVSQMKEESSVISPVLNFAEYLKQHDLPNVGTAQAISIDSISDLDKLLRDNRIFVFRLGRSSSRGETAFCGVRYPNEEALPIIIDERDFLNTEIEGFIPRVSYATLHPFFLVPKLSETSVVNLGLASGLVPHALGIEGEISIPATGKSTYTFEFRPLRGADTVLTHRDGQVEIDALFTGRRDGRDALFLLEAKKSKTLSSLSNHKLVYPYLAIKPLLPSYMPLVMVYLRVIVGPKEMIFYVNECDDGGRCN